MMTDYILSHKDTTLML